MDKRGNPMPKKGLSDLELTIINNHNHEQNDGLLREAQAFLADKYTSNKVLSYNSAKKELSDRANEAYQWIVKKDEQGKVVAVVVLDVFDVPKSASNRRLVSDNRNHYTALYYATAADESYEPTLQAMISGAIKTTKVYSKNKGKRNVGILTDDVRHINVLRKLGGKYLGEVGVPTLEDIPEDVYAIKNFIIDDHEKLFMIPFSDRRLKKSVIKKMVANYLDQGYNQKGAGEPGYKPLTAGPFLNPFVKDLKANHPGRYVDLKKVA